ncbi:MAG: NAD(P)-dependent glycerol-3-phosphate dehydrogenase [Candidatus Omnitrophica bacterium]|nr:NAD(P)-dependent glycerol-3-phosphate dehydrogenase [Candidatus Omnitrophota bacterium]MCM8800183.1 NAD(P)-dependent glycerol-3-phosphate dehydrogenase [Candidatus Omnitrophota bacterium]
MNITVLGDGGWGTTLAILLDKKGYNLTLWSVFPEYARYLDKKRINVKFLPGIKIPKDIKITSDLKDAIFNKDLIILAIPSLYLRSILRKVKLYPYPKESIFLSVIKGIELNSLMRMSEVIKQELGNIKLGVLSGPTIAYEVARGIPTTAVVASEDKSISKFLQDIFITDKFRIYTNSDIIGVELGGALKNIIAIACGIADGLGFGTNTKSALLTRGLVEIMRLGIKMGAKQQTFFGISGLGDMATTCMSLFSRNRFVGEQIGRGRKLKAIIKSMKMVAEGIYTTKAGYLLSKKYKVEMPITEEVYLVLYKNKSPLRAVKTLMLRRSKEEEVDFGAWRSLD